MPDAHDALEDYPDRDEIIDSVKELFSTCGWEGDGTIQIMWLPSFLKPGNVDGMGLYMFHVKQSNNGTSYIASPIKLPFPELLFWQLPHQHGHDA